MDNDRRSLTPCLDENAVEQNAKSLSDLSDISDEDEKNWDELQKNESNKNGKDPNDLFKKITKKARERNYRDKAAAPPVAKNQRDVSGDRTKRSQKRSEIQRYDVRSVIRDGREFSFSKSRSRSRSPANRISHHKKVLRSPLRNRHNSDSSRRYSRRHSRSPTPKYNDRNSSDKINRKSRYSSNYRSSTKDESRSRHRKSRKSRSPSDSRKTSSSRQIKNISQENIKIILQNKEAPPSKRSKHSKKDKKSKKQHRDHSESRDNKKDNTPGDGISKEVIASGDNILISVSFSNKNNVQKDKIKEKSPEIVSKSPKRRKSLTPKSPPITTSKRSKVKKQRRERRHSKTITNSQQQNNSNNHPIKNIRKNDLKPIAFIDLDKSPGKEVVLQSPKEIIILTDSENEGTRKDNSSKDVMIVEDIVIENPPPESPPLQQPQQPVLKFSISKKSNILPFNLLHDHEDENAEKEDEEGEQNEQIERHSNDVYDPFNPTNSKSNSPTHLQQILNDVSSSSDMIKNRKDSPSMEKNCLEENIISSTNSIRIEKKSSTPPPLMIPSSLLNVKSVPFYDNSFDFKTFKAPSPKIVVVTQHEKKTLIEDDEATPYSPSSEGYQGYEAPMEPESPKEHEVSNDSCFNDDLKKKNMPKNVGTLSNFKSMQDMQYGRKPMNKNEQNFFDTLHPPQQKSPSTKRQSILRSKIKRYRNSLMDIDSLIKPPMFNEKSTAKDDPFNDDDVPNSAVDLLNKDKMLKKSLRIERVAEEVKLVLKPHYNKKHITKEEYKEILRKAVPKIYHNKTGEINIQKIHNLVEAYIKKFRYRRKSSTQNVNL